MPLTTQQVTELEADFQALARIIQNNPKDFQTIEKEVKQFLEKWQIYFCEKNQWDVVFKCARCFPTRPFDKCGLPEEGQIDALYDAFEAMALFVLRGKTNAAREKLLQTVRDFLELRGKLNQKVKGQPGRRGYPLEALKYAQELRAKNPEMKTHSLRRKCLDRFSEDDLPPDGESFRRWLNRPRKNRAN